MTDLRPNSMSGAELAVLTARFEELPARWRTPFTGPAARGFLTIARDFSCIILTARPELLTAADSLPIHVLRGPEVMSRTMNQIHPELRRGDAFLHNSPYHGCTHPADHRSSFP